MYKLIKATMILLAISFVSACKDDPKESSSLLNSTGQLSASTSVDINSTIISSSVKEDEISSISSSNFSVSSDLLDSTDSIEKSSGGLKVSENTDSGDWGTMYG